MGHLDYNDASLHVCPRCGIRSAGQHENARECIDALRSVIAKMQFRCEQRTGARRPPASGRGGFRNRTDARMVLLDGHRITLTEAGRRLGLSPSALHHRIVHRTGTTDYADVDLRAIQADAKRGPGGRAALAD